MGVKKLKKLVRDAFSGGERYKERDWNPFGFQSLIEER